MCVRACDQCERLDTCGRSPGARAPARGCATASAHPLVWVLFCQQWQMCLQVSSRCAAMGTVTHAASCANATSLGPCMRDRPCACACACVGLSWQGPPIPTTPWAPRRLHLWVQSPHAQHRLHLSADPLRGRALEQALAGGEHGEVRGGVGLIRPLRVREVRRH
eukprot:2260118-Alexandrium_andersonii.AAC.1